MRWARFLIWFILALTLFFSAVLILKAIYVNEWATVASSLSVITAVIAALLSLKIVWKQEDDIRPDLLVYFDVDSRAGLTQIVLKNVGGSTAYNVRVEWENSLIGVNKKEINFNYIPVLQKNNEIKKIVNATIDIFQEAKPENPNLIFRGKISYLLSISSKVRTTQKFEISLDQFRGKVRPLTDEQDFYLKNIGLSEHIKSLNLTLENIAKLLEKKDPTEK